MFTSSAVAALVFLNPIPDPDAGGQDPIVLQETGVARAYTAQKTITCGELQWRVSWSSTMDGEINGDIVFMFADGGAVLAQAQDEIFSRLSFVNSVSATCNRDEDADITRSRLLISGTSETTGTPAFAQVYFDQDQGTAGWSFDIE